MQDHLSFDTHHVTADVSSGTGSATITMYPDGGYLWVEWNLYGTMVANYIDSCTGAGVDRIDLELTDDQTMAVTNVSFPCEDNNGRGEIELEKAYSVGGAIKPIAKGYYNITGKAFAGGTQVGATSTTASQSIEDRNKINIFGTGISIDLTNR